MLQLRHIYPTDNEWDVPVLLPGLQGIPITPPVCAWGTVSRSSWMPGTWVYYVEDRRFAHVLDSPEQPVPTGCNSCSELNLSLFDDSPMAEAIWAIYRKRWVARSWQEHGIRVLVDLNVPERYARLNLLGVPRGWKAYSTRGYASRPDDLLRECALAEEWSGGGSTVLVFGGGEATRERCRAPGNAVWVADHMEQHRDRAEKKSKRVVPKKPTRTRFRQLPIEWCQRQESTNVEG